MDIPSLLVMNSIFLGVGLSADAFSVSVINGLSQPGLHPLRAAKIAAIFAFFQALMPMTGWILTNFMLQYFTALQHLIPIISLVLLGCLGSKMIWDSKKSIEEYDTSTDVIGTSLLIQGIATSLDALSVGFAISEYALNSALLCSIIIAIITFIICYIGVMIGKSLGCKLTGKAEVFGGAILIAIGIEIFLKSL